VAQESARESLESCDAEDLDGAPFDADQSISGKIVQDARKMLRRERAGAYRDRRVRVGFARLWDRRPNSSADAVGNRRNG
jgi:predicted neutral ceramidase superfamily lipid hydrolase